ncbi:MAG TPA: Hint domain-containing protein, partial [Stellaceae bacterium]|nr:Hint domain-containing protein [Stellaceae bacterium]
MAIILSGTGLHPRGAGDSLSYDEDEKVGLITLLQHENGSFAPGDSSGFGLAANMAIDPASVLPPSAGLSAVTPVISQYFLAIDGLTGGSTDAAHVGWFEINGFSFDLSNAPASFTPLDVFLSLTPYVVGALSDIALGTQIPSVRLEGVTSSGEAVYDLTLADVPLTFLWDYGSAGELRFDGYQQVGLITKIQNDDGSFSTDQSYGYDLSTSTEIDPASLPDPSPGPWVGTGPEVAQYFLLIDGLNGGSTDENHVGWFEVELYSPFSFQVSNTPGGAAVFSPLDVNLNLNPDVAEALRDIALGRQIPSVRLEGVTSSITGAAAVYDLTLADVTLTGLVDHLGVHDLLRFDYQQLGLTTKVQNGDGSFSPGDSFGFDLAANTEIDPASLPSPSPEPPAGVTPDVTQYFLQIDGITGGSTDIDHVGWFDVNYGFNFTVTAPASGGLAVFEPLYVSLTLDPGLVGPLGDIPWIKLEGVTSGISGGLAVYDLTLSHGSLTAGADSLTFDGYDQLGLITMIQNGDGSFSPGESFGFDLPTNTEIDPNSVACFCRGTQILTDRGEVPVEDLAIGDRVMTLSGEAQPIRWTGHRAYDGRFIAGNRAVLPIRIAAGALADGVPARDLCVSPGHALCINGVLLAAELVLNGTTIAQMESVETVEYFHVEFDRHEVIVADGTPCESYVDCDNRRVFANGAEYARLYPDDERPRWAYCAKRLDWDSPELLPIRSRLLERAAERGSHALATDPDVHLIVDGAIVRPNSFAGGAHRFAVPGGANAVWIASRCAVPAEIVAESRDTRRLGVPVERITLYDGDLSIEAGHGHAGLGDGFHDDEASHR